MGKGVFGRGKTDLRNLHHQPMHARNGTRRRRRLRRLADIDRRMHALALRDLLRSLHHRLLTPARINHNLRSRRPRQR